MLTAAQCLARKEELNMPPKIKSVEHVSKASEEHIHEHGDYVASPTATITRYSARFHKPTHPAEHQDIIHNLPKNL